MIYSDAAFSISSPSINSPKLKEEQEKRSSTAVCRIRIVVLVKSTHVLKLLDFLSFGGPVLVGLSRAICRRDKVRLC